jgi:phosphate transport system substrate-binding protein
MATTGRLFAAIVLIATVQCSSPSADAANLSGAGSTFALPVLATWTRTYLTNTGSVVRYQPVGSAMGIRWIKSRKIDFGTSDAPVKANELEATGMIQFPLVIGGVVPVVNIRAVGPGQLRLTGPVLAQIFLGKITYWDDPAIVNLNPQLGLPHQPIVPGHRAADSGTRYIFSDYLAKVSSEWKDNLRAPASPAQVLAGTGSSGNELVAVFTAGREGAIGYVEYAYAKRHKLAYVLLQNREGEFVAPSVRSFKSAAANADWSNTPSFQLLLTNQPGQESWPIAGSTFVLTYKEQYQLDSGIAMFSFFDWVYRNGVGLADDLDYAPIPHPVVQLIEKQWAEVKARDGGPVWFGAPNRGP